MANNYMQYSVAIAIKDTAKVKEILDVIEIIENEHQYESTSLQVMVATGMGYFPHFATEEWLGNLNDEINGDGGGPGTIEIADHTLFCYAEESGNLDALVLILQAAISYGAIDCEGAKGILVTWADTCSRMRPGEFGGGAMFVTEDAVHWQPSPELWVESL